MVFFVTSFSFAAKVGNGRIDPKSSSTLFISKDAVFYVSDGAKVFSSNQSIDSNEETIKVLSKKESKDDFDEISKKSIVKKRKRIKEYIPESKRLEVFYIPIEQTTAIASQNVKQTFAVPIPTTQHFISSISFWWLKSMHLPFAEKKLLILPTLKVSNPYCSYIQSRPPPGNSNFLYSI